MMKEQSMSQQRDRIEMAIDEIKAPLLKMDGDAVGRLADEALAARRIVIYAMGRELLSLRAFGMRLVHHGLDAHIAGDVTALPVTKGDLVIISAGPGDLAMAEAMAGLVRKSGARLAVITAQPQGTVPRMADSVYVIPAQTMADDIGSVSILPMGTVYEIAMLIFVDLVAVQIRESTGQSLDDVRARHFNLE
jgi:6-phospho-3-hexuloisomerase